MSPRPIRNQALGEFVRRHRMAKGWSLRQLAQVANVDYSFLAKLEGGQVGSVAPERLTRIGRALDANVSDLYVLAGHTFPTTQPSLPMYLRTANPNLTEKDVREIEEHFQRLSVRRGGGQAGPGPGEDEQ